MDDETDFDDEMMLSSSPAVRYALLVAGTISIVLGVIGLMLPLVPTTPFLLVAAACYARSSKKFYVWLMTNRWFGRYIRDWRQGRGIPLSGKIGSTLMIFVTIGTSAYLFVPINWVRALLAGIALAVSAYIWSQPTKRREPTQ